MNLKYTLQIILVIFFFSIPVFTCSQTFSLSKDLYNEAVQGVGMRALGMAGTFVHIATENPVYYNPAASIEESRYKLTNNSTFLIGKSYLFANSLLLRLTDRIFFSWAGTSDSEIGHTFIGGYALPLNKLFSLGFTGKGKLKGDAAGIGCDIGFLGKFHFVRFGIMVQDLFTNVGQDIEPMDIRIGIGIEPLKGFGINLQGDLKEVIEESKIYFRTRVRTGLEGRFLNDFFGIRAGYATLGEGNEFAITGGIETNFKYLSINYTYVGSWKNRENVDNAHWISTEFFFWPKSPEEIEREMTEREERNRLAVEEKEKVKEKEESKKVEEKKSKKGEFETLYSDLEKTKSELLNTKVELEKLKVYSSQLEKELNEFKKRDVVPVKISSMEELRQKLPRQVWTRTISNGIVIVLSGNTFFSLGTSTVNPASYSILNEIISLLGNYPQYKINVEGYTDSLGSDDKNIALSISRAKDVANYLISNGISKERIVTIYGYGSKNPVASNLTESGRLYNRRVEITVYE